MVGQGTLVNALAVVAGALVGIAGGQRLPQRYNEMTMQAVGGVVVVIGVQMALGAESGEQVIAVLISLVLGSIVGELVNIEARLDRFGRILQDWFARTFSGSAAGRHGSSFVQGFMTASLLFCVGPMAILGAIQDGLVGDATILYTKSALDGIAAAFLAAALGLGTMFSVIPLVLYQGAITLMAGFVRAVLTDPVVHMVTITGGVMILGIGMNLWGVTKLRIGNMLPALVLAGVAGAFVCG